MPENRQIVFSGLYFDGKTWKEYSFTIEPELSLSTIRFPLSFRKAKKIAGLTESETTGWYENSQNFPKPIAKPIRRQLTNDSSDEDLPAPVKRFCQLYPFSEVPPICS